MDGILQIIKNTYFGKLFQKDKLIFLVAFMFFSLSLLANLIKLETSPFFVWNMYSERYYPRKDYDIIEIRYNGNEVLNFKHTWQSPQQAFLTEPLYNYLNAYRKKGEDPAREYLMQHWAVKHPAFRSLANRLYNTPADYDAFPAWYKGYLSEVKGMAVYNVTIMKKKLGFNEDGGVKCLSTDTLLLIP
jgi:hypothetical protein